MWVLGDEAYESNVISEDAALNRYFGIAGRLSLVVLPIVILCGFITLIPTPGYTTDAQSVANYVGTLLGTVVALAGSLVAISLAIQALNVSKEQNRQSIASRPEYEKGLDAAMAYARFKGILILLPFELRAAQRTNPIDSKTILSGSPDDASLTSLTKHLNELSDTTFITLFNSIAWKYGGDGTGDDSQFLFLNRFAALQSAKNVIRGVQLALTMKNEIDEVIRQMHDKMPKFDSFEQYRVAMKDSDDKANLTEIEFWFIKHAYPYVNLDRTITFGDFEDLKTKAKNSLDNFAKKNGVIIDDIKSYKDISLIDDSYATKNPATVIVSLEDSSLFKILDDNRKYFSTKNTDFKTISMQIPSVEDLKKEGVIQVVLPNLWDVKLTQLLSVVKEAGDARKAKLLVVFDQIGLYKDSLKADSKYLTLGQQLDFWKFCRHLCNLLAQSEIQIKQGLRKPSFQANKHDHKDEWNKFRDSKEHLNSMRLLLKNLDTPAREIFSSKRDNYITILKAAGDKIGVTVGIEVGDTDDFNEVMLFKLSEIGSESMRLDFTDDEIKIINHLAKSPLFDRPFYGLRYLVNSAYTDIPSKMPDNMQMLAYVNFDNNLDWPINIFIEWMMVKPNNKGTHKDIYWID